MKSVPPASAGGSLAQVLMQFQNSEVFILNGNADVSSALSAKREIILSSRLSARCGRDVRAQHKVHVLLLRLFLKGDAK